MPVSESFFLNPPSIALLASIPDCRIGKTQRKTVFAFLFSERFARGPTPGHNVESLVLI